MKKILFILLLYQIECNQIPLTRTENKVTGNGIYLCVISIGKQDFNVELNLHAPILWVPECIKDSACPSDLENCCDGPCTNRNVFDRFSSRTFQSLPNHDPIRFPFFYCSSIAFVIGMDEFKPGPHYKPGPQTARVEFGLARGMPPCYQRVPFDGVLGLAPTMHYRLSSPLIQFLRQGGYANPIISLFIMKPSLNNLIDGMLTIGTVDARCSPPDFYIPCNLQLGWVFEVPTFSLNNIAFPTPERWTGIVDLNSDAFYVPRMVLDFIVETTGATFIPSTKRYLLKGDKEWIISVHRGEFRVTINLVHLCDRREMNQGCVLNIDVVPLGSLGNFIFGTPILYDNCLVLDFRGSLAFPKKRKDSSS